MTNASVTNFTRRGLLKAFAATAVTAAPTYSNAFGFLRGAGDIRSLKMYSARTGETINMVYWVDGKYVPDAMKEINYFMRDFRQSSVAEMDRRTVDIIAATQNLLNTDKPFLLLSGYRTPTTNNMLRRSGRGVAKNSYHMKAQAADLSMEGRSVGQIYGAAFSCAAGGVGRYSRSNFVHVDCGPLRTWGR
ncbi:MAG: YcbK family protein [Planktomarina sp.]